MNHWNIHRIAKLEIDVDHMGNVDCFIPFWLTLPEKVSFIKDVIHKHPDCHLHLYLAADKSGRSYKEIHIPNYLSTQTAPEAFESLLIHYLDV